MMMHSPEQEYKYDVEEEIIIETDSGEEERLVQRPEH